jgi:hypothetical protein
MCAHSAAGQQRVDEEEPGEDEDEFVPDLELLEVGQRHITSAVITSTTWDSGA